MSGPHTIAVLVRETTIVMTGYKVVEVARHAGLKPIYSGVSRGWVTDAHKLGDLLAFCQRRRIEVTVTQPLEVHHGELRGVHHRDDDHHDDGADQQLDLFEDGAA